MKLILASVSPRRRELLRQCGIACDVLPVSADELSRPGEMPEETALRLAREKARLALDRIGGRAGWILAADTVVADGGQALGKPRDTREAEAFLLRLRGREHRVITGVCLMRAPDGVEERPISRSRPFACGNIPRRSSRNTWRAATRWIRPGRMPFSIRPSARWHPSPDVTLMWSGFPFAACTRFWKARGKNRIVRFRMAAGRAARAVSLGFRIEKQRRVTI